MRRGFTDYAATILIPDFPGETARWYAEKYLQEPGNTGSDARDKVQSLASTLDKQVREGRERRVRRDRINGLYRFFPASASGEGHQEKGGSSLENIVAQIPLSMQELKDIDNLVAVDKFNNRSDAIKWLVMQGIAANRAYLDKVADIRMQIDRLKSGLAAESEEL